MEARNSTSMKKVSFLSKLGVELDIAQSMFKPVLDNHAALAADLASRRQLTKITVVGVGNVGMAVAQTILTQDLADELALVDANADKLRGEMLDLQHAAAFLPRVRILASSDPGYAVTKGSDLCIVTAGARQMPGETRLALLKRNLAVFRAVIPPLAAQSPNALLLIVSNPVDVLTYIAWKLSGFPSNRVIGSGTNLDSSRFRFMLADHFDANAQDVQAYMVGEHGDSSVALWSSISIAGVPILSYIKGKSTEDFEQRVLEDTRKAVVESAYRVIQLKGYTSWAIGYSVANLARSLLRDQRRIHPVSLLAKGLYGIGDDKEVYLSLPAQLGRGGVVSVVDVRLADEEKRKLQESAEALWEVQQDIDL